MTYYYKAIYSDPGSADLVFAKLRQQFPGIDMHIEEPNRPFQSTSETDTEFERETSFAMLAPLTPINMGPAEVLSSNVTVGPSPYGAIESLLVNDPHSKLPKGSGRTVIYGSCSNDIKSALIENLRRYGSDSVIVSKMPV